MLLLSCQWMIVMSDSNSIAQQMWTQYPSTMFARNSASQPKSAWTCGTRQTWSHLVRQIHYQSANQGKAPNQFTCLLGLDTVQKMKLFTINDERFISNVSNSDLGDLGKAHLHVHVDSNVRPKALTCRMIPIALQSLVREELQKLEDRGVLIPIMDPTPWVSQMAIARKANGKLNLIKISPFISLSVCFCRSWKDLMQPSSRHVLVT